MEGSIEYGITGISLIPVRKDPAETAEMVTQLLFGEPYKVLETYRSKWALIKADFDQYKGWIDMKTHTRVSYGEYEVFRDSLFHITRGLAIAYKKGEENYPFYLLPGSVICRYFKKDSSFRLKDTSYKITREVVADWKKGSREDIIQTALMYYGAPYVWGGKSLFGLDCSGLVQVVCRINGIMLPRDANQQIEAGTDVESLEYTRPGDLCFFVNEDGNISHVGFLIDDNKVLHASGSVRIDTIDKQGIWDAGQNKYTHVLHTLKDITQL